MNRKEIKEIVAKLTLEEKASLCSGKDMFATQEIPRLQIPSCNLSDGPHGVRKQEGKQDFMGENVSVTAVCFPAACATGSSFDPGLLEEMGRALGQNCQKENVQVLLGPGINIKRNPLCGRNFEYFSEDPYVSGVLGAAYVRGVQSEGVGTCLKHFLVNNQESRRRTQSSEPDERTLREIYTPAFEAVIKESSPWSVMASYNKIHGIYATENGKYLKTLLRDEWKYEGAVVSDWAAVHDRTAAVKGGCALTMPGDKAHDHLITEAVLQGEISEEELDFCCEQIVELAMKGWDCRKEEAGFDYEKAHRLAGRIAGESIVLLKNDDDVLPLKPGAQKLALIGKFAEAPRYQGRGSSQINAYRVPSILDITAEESGICYAQGFDFGENTDAQKLQDAVYAAQAADAAVIFAGLPPVMESEGYDRWTMKLPPCQNELIEAVCKVQKNTIVVLQNGSPVEMPWADSVKGIVEAYLGGEAVSEAVWDVLTGRINPCGHLAETFPVKLSDNPSYLFWPGEGDRVEYNEGIYVGYRYYTTKELAVRFPFGHGLSYTSFEYTDLSVDRNTFSAGETLRVEVTVKNTGDRPGKALAQIYVGTSPNSMNVKRPLRELKAFEKVFLEPGESRRLSFALDKRSFAYWDKEAHGWRVAGGVYQIQAGWSAEEICLSQEVKAEDEFLPSNTRYTIMTPICDAGKNPAGKAFLERIMPAVDAMIKRMGKGKDSEPMPYEELRPVNMGLMSEPLQTLKRMLPDITEAEWENTLEEMNRIERNS